MPPPPATRVRRERDSTLHMSRGCVAELRENSGAARGGEGVGHAGGAHGKHGARAAAPRIAEGLGEELVLDVRASLEGERADLANDVPDLHFYSRVDGGGAYEEVLGKVVDRFVATGLSGEQDACLLAT